MLMESRTKSMMDADPLNQSSGPFILSPCRYFLSHAKQATLTL